MRRILWIGLVIASLATGLSGTNLQSVSADEAADAKAADEKAVRSTADTFAKAYNAHDAKAVAALFAEDADYVDEDGTPVRGQKAIEADYTELFSDGIPHTIKIKVHAVRFVTPDVAIEDGSFTVSPEPPGPPADRKYTAVHVKHEDKWHISSIRDTRTTRASHYDHLKELEFMIGDWVDESHESLVETTCEWAANKNYIIRKYKVKIAGVNSTEGVQRIGWDPVNNRIRSWLFDSDGGYGEGHWTKDGNRWIIESSGALPDGTSVSATNVLTRIDNDKFTWASQDRSQGDERVSDIGEITIVRKPPAAKPQ